MCPLNGCLCVRAQRLMEAVQEARRKKNDARKRTLEQQVVFDELKALL